MPDLSTLVEELLREARRGAKGAKKKSKKTSPASPPLPSIKPLYSDEALVLIAINTTCETCKKESLSWNNALYVERKSKRLKNPVVSLERIETCAYSCTYSALPKRVEIINRTSPCCPLCFGLFEAEGGISPRQMSFPFAQEPEAKSDRRKTGKVDYFSKLPIKPFSSWEQEYYENREDGA